jgi:anthranilate phosphoribosyltransferase
LNAAAAIAAFEGDVSADLHARISAGLKRAIDAVDSGKATELLSKWSTLTQNLAAQ